MGVNGKLPYSYSCSIRSKFSKFAFQLYLILYKNRQTLSASHSVNKQHTSRICGSANNRKKSRSCERSFYRMIRFQLWPIRKYLISELVQVFNPVGKPRICQARWFDLYQKRTAKIDVDIKRSQFLQKEMYFQIISTFIWASRQQQRFISQSFSVK